MPKVYTAQEAIKIFNEMMRCGRPLFPNEFDAMGEQIDAGRMVFHVSAEAMIDRGSLFEMPPDYIAHIVECNWQDQARPLIRDAWDIRSETCMDLNAIKLRMDVGFVSTKMDPNRISLEEAISQSIRYTKEQKMKEDHIKRLINL